MGITGEAAVLRVTDMAIETHSFAGFRIHHRAMIIRSKKEHRTVRHHLVENFPREIMFTENSGIPAMAFYPIAFGMRLGEQIQCRLKLVDRPETGKIDIERVTLAGILQMNVSILEAGKDQP